MAKLNNWLAKISYGSKLKQLTYSVEEIKIIPIGWLTSVLKLIFDKVKSEDNKSTLINDFFMKFDLLEICYVTQISQQLR